MIIPTNADVGRQVVHTIKSAYSEETKTKCATLRAFGPDTALIAYTAGGNTVQFPSQNSNGASRNQNQVRHSMTYNARWCWRISRISSSKRSRAARERSGKKTKRREPRAVG
jgi:hypothetical protein